MRGKVPCDQSANRHIGITPAYAGKSQRIFCRSPGNEDHPRLCGEKCLLTLPHSYLIGSPPPMRGKVEPIAARMTDGRITPAYAGKSRDSLIPDCIHKDHPRLCGEKCSFSPTAPMKMGSPPPMRGKVLSALIQERRYRITPAYAGKSPTGQGRLHR